MKKNLFLIIITAIGILSCNNEDLYDSGKSYSKTLIRENNNILHLTDRPYNYILKNDTIFFINFSKEIIAIDIKTGNATKYFTPNEHIVDKTFTYINKNDSIFNFYPLDEVKSRYPNLYRIVGISKHNDQLYILGLIKTAIKKEDIKRIFREMYALWIIDNNKKIKNIITGFESCSDKHDIFISNKRNFLVIENKVFFPVFSTKNKKVDFISYDIENNNVNGCEVFYNKNINSSFIKKSNLNKNNKFLFSNHNKGLYFDGVEIKDINGKLIKKLKFGNDDYVTDFSIDNTKNILHLLMVRVNKTKQRKSLNFYLLKIKNNIRQDSIYIGNNDTIKNVRLFDKKVYYFTIDSSDNVFLVKVKL